MSITNCLREHAPNFQSLTSPKGGLTMTATAQVITDPAISILRRIPDAPILSATGPTSLALLAGTTVNLGGEVRAFEADTPVACDFKLKPGQDVEVILDADGQPRALPFGTAGDQRPVIGGGHFAPGGNAVARKGGDTVPAFNPHSLWDAMFRPACADPRGAALVTHDPLGRPKVPEWVDIYPLNEDHLTHGTSAAGLLIARGNNPPVRCDGDGRYDGLDWETASEIYAFHGKALLSDETFRAATYGTTEAKSRGTRIERTGFADPEIDAQFTSRWGVFNATGCIWVHGTDGDPDITRYTILGGNWGDGSGAGSRASVWDVYPWNSNSDIGARGRSDHLKLG